MNPVLSVPASSGFYWLTAENLLFVCLRAARPSTGTSSWWVQSSAITDSHSLRVNLLRPQMGCMLASFRLNPSQSQIEACNDHACRQVELACLACRAARMTQLAGEWSFLGSLAMSSAAASGPPTSQLTSSAAWALHAPAPAHPRCVNAPRAALKWIPATLCAPAHATQPVAYICEENILAPGMHCYTMWFHCMLYH